MKDEEDDLSDDSFLTPRQLEVLKYRLEGRSQEEIARILGTTRSNVSILERRAHQNIRRAQRTLELWTILQAPIRVRIQAGTDLFQVPQSVFAEADRLGIVLPITSVEMIVRLREQAPMAMRRRVLESDLDIYVTTKGEVLVATSPGGNGSL